MCGECRVTDNAPDDVSPLAPFAGPYEAVPGTGHVGPALVPLHARFLWLGRVLERSQPRSAALKLSGSNSARVVSR